MGYTPEMADDIDDESLTHAILERQRSSFIKMYLGMCAI